MALSILGGQAQGFSLKVPPGNMIRPMSVRLKRSLFDAHQDLRGLHFVDLCGGSGAVGLEAWSRGAAAVSFYEKSYQVYRYLRANLQRVREHYQGNSDSLNLVRGDCLQYLRNISSCPDRLLFLAPPYLQHQLYCRALEAMVQGGFRGRVWVESDRQKGLTESVICRYITAQKIYRQGTCFVVVGAIKSRK